MSRARDPQQAGEQRRVAANLAPLILDFVANHELWHSRDLTDFVERRAAAAPGSADRTLRSLRRARLLNYEVASRTRSLYRRLPIPPPPTWREPEQVGLFEAQA